MKTSEYYAVATRQASHFYYVGNRAIIVSLLKNYLQKLHTHLPMNSFHILDAGCGTGHLVKDLNKFGQVDAIDISPIAVKLAKAAHVNASIASVNELPYRNNSFDVIVSMDVLYHRLVNDQRALRECYRTLKPGGLLIVRVPAHPLFMTFHDRLVHTRERYTKNGLQKNCCRQAFTSINFHTQTRYFFQS